MNHPYKKFVQLQVAMMILTLVLAIIALIYGSPVLALITCFTLALSFTFEGLVELKKKHTFQFAQQILRSIIIVVIVCYFYFI